MSFCDLLKIKNIKQFEFLQITEAQKHMNIMPENWRRIKTTGYKF